MKGGSASRFVGMAAEEYWFCLNHHTVEERDGCKAADRLGPYPSREDAGRALEKVQQRNEAWDNDPDWTDDKTDED